MSDSRDLVRVSPDEKRFLLIVVVSGIGFGMTGPFTALFAASLGASDFMAGFAVSSIAVSLLVVDVAGTRLVTRVDGRFAIWFSLVVFGAGSIASAMSPSLWGMITARMFQGLGVAFFLGGGLTVAIGIRPPSESGRAIGVFNSAWFLGIACGPLAGGYLASQRGEIAGYRLVFLACGLVCLVIAIFARALLPQLPTGSTPELSLPTRPRPLQGFRLWPPLTLSGFGQGVRGGLAFATVPWLGEHVLNLGVGMVALGIALLGLIDIVAMRIGGALTDRHGRRGVLVGALLWGSVSCLAARIVEGPAVFVLWCAACGVVVGVLWVVPPALVLDVVDESEAGIASYRIIADVGQLFGGTIAGLLIGVVGAVNSISLIGLGFAFLAVWVFRMPESAAA